MVMGDGIGVPEITGGGVGGKVLTHSEVWEESFLPGDPSAKLRD